MQKTLDQKLARIHADPSGCRDFILADAKDADMAFGIGSTGELRQTDGTTRRKSLEEYRAQIRQVIEQGLVDIVLMSGSTSEQLALIERRFENSPVTPAVRANDATDVHIPRAGQVHTHPALPFRSSHLDHLQTGKLNPTAAERQRGVNLGLYSVTFNNDAERDRHTLEQYRHFREEAERVGFRHFLEVFDPNLPEAVPAEQVPHFVNDCIARTLAAVPKAGRPVFLKMVYHGPAALEELVSYDPHLVVGVLGGSAGTTFDAFKLLHDAKKHGARAALFGRKINQAEHQLAFIQFLRLIADGDLQPEEAVRAYHGVLRSLNIPPRRKLAEDLQTTATSGGYGRSRTAQPRAAASLGTGDPDFRRMTPAEKVKWNLERMRRVLG